MKLKFSAKKEWVKVQKDGKCQMLDLVFYEGRTQEKAQARLLDKITRLRQLVGIECIDCYLVHPGKFGMILWGIVKAYFEQSRL